MKYILLMTGTSAGVDTYRAWNKNDIDAHMAGLKSLAKDLRKSGEYVADQGLTGPEEAKVVRGQKKGMPITAPADCIKCGQSKPSSKESTVPETAPTAARIVVPLAHRIASKR